MSDGDLIELFPTKRGDPSDAEAPVRRAPRDPGESYCLHRHVRLHHESRRVYCDDCDREVPAFDQLTAFVAEWERYAQHRDRARTDAKRAQERLDDLKRQEGNAKSRLRTVRRKLSKADPAWGRLDALLASHRPYLSREQLSEALYGDEPVEVSDVS